MAQNPSKVFLCSRVLIGNMEKLEMIFDMETQDPDDYLTLLLLLGHPRVDLIAVTIVPGSKKQVGLVRRTLAAFGRDIPIGSYDINYSKPCVSVWHEKAFGKITPSSDAVPAGKLLAQLCSLNTTLVTGAANKNLGKAMKYPSFTLGRWVAQGGFAGDGVVPEELQLGKFKGRTTCPTYNLNGDPSSVLEALKDERIKSRMFVSKNVCHGVQYNYQVHLLLKAALENNGRQSHEWIYKGMDYWLRKNGLNTSVVEPDTFTGDTMRLIDENGISLGVLSAADAFAIAEKRKLKIVMRRTATSPHCDLVDFSAFLQVGKKLHDPLAACCAIDPSIGEWKSVELFRHKGEWGSRLKSGTNTQIIVSLDENRFHNIFLQ